MYQHEIKQQAANARNELRAVQAEANRNVAVARAGLVMIQAQCDHPNKFKTVTMGDMGTHCPDCLRST